MINIRQKGATAEREVAKALNSVIKRNLEMMGLPVPEVDIVQRNQNQSAVGGNDLANCFGLSIEVKRQEQLSVNTWWKQCVAAATRNDECPVLIYKQNRKPWRVVLMAWLPVACAGVGSSGKVEYDRHPARVEISWEAFIDWFDVWVKQQLRDGAKVNV